MFKIHVAFSIQNSILTKSFPTILGIKYNQKNAQYVYLHLYRYFSALIFFESQLLYPVWFLSLYILDSKPIC